MIGGLIAAGIAALAGITGGIIQYHSNKKTNEANKQNVENTNQTNKEIQESVNQTNQDLQNSVNETNAQIASDTNAANERIQNSINETNAANVAATNAANAQIAADTNAANAEIYKGVNETNIALNAATNETNKAIAEQNLQFQRENLDYQKALQQQVFEREDTAYQRTAYDMAQAGLNPLTMNGTNGAGEVVSTSALNNDYRAQSAQVMPYNAQSYQAIAAQAQAAHLQPYEAKAIQHIANKMQSFQAQMQSFDWLTQTLGSVGSQVDKAIQHGIQMDTLKEQMKNNEVDRIAKLRGTGYFMENGKPVPANYIDSNGNVYNPRSLEINRMAYENKSLEHDLEYGLFNTSSDWERKITGLQYLMDTHRLQSVAGSITNEAFDIFNNLQKMYNRSF